MFVLSSKFVGILVTLFNTLVESETFSNMKLLPISTSACRTCNWSRLVINKLRKKRWFSFLRKKCKLKIHKGWKYLKFPVYSWIFSALICVKCVLSIHSLITKRHGNPSCFSFLVDFIGQASVTTSTIASTSFAVTILWFGFCLRYKRTSNGI